MNPERFDAVVLAGGRGSRMGGADKAALRLDGVPLVDRVVRAARSAGARRVVVAGPVHAIGSADVAVREDPPFSGPLAALAAALGEMQEPWLMLLACDLEHPAAVAEQLRGALSADPDLDPDRDSDPDGAVLIDAEGRAQWLAGCYRSDAVRVAVAAAAEDAGPGQEPGSLADLPLRAALGRLRLRRLVAQPFSTDDIDTPEDLARAEANSRKALR